MDSRFPPDDGYGLIRGVKNAFTIYAYLAAAAFAVALMTGWTP